MRSTRRGFMRRLLLATEPARSESGGRTLVCVFLRGGADTLNMLVPYGDDKYYEVRPTLAIPPPEQNEGGHSAIRLDDFYAFHPRLQPLLPAYREGRLAIIQGVGSDNPTGSHFEAQDQMEYGESYGKAVGGGWLGRHLRTRGADMPLSAVAIGPTIPESLRAAPSASAVSTVEEIQLKTLGESERVCRALAALYEAEVAMLSESGRQTLALLNRVEAMRSKEYVPANNADYPGGSFGAGLKEIARLVKAEIGLEVACVDLGGWDTHFFQGSSSGLQADVIDELGRGLAAFDLDLAAYRDRVTTLVMTEFGRRIYENSSMGTDHGRGFALLALGGRLNGGRIIGEWPGLEEESGPGPGGLKINLDYRSVLSEVLTGLMGNQRIDLVFPDFQPERIGLVRN